jgi:transcriptional regulator with XRE-family HTH domain
LNDTASGPQDPAIGRPGRSLAEKTEWLIQNMWPPDVPEAKTNAEIADAIRKATGEDLSYTAIWKLRTGRGDNPTLRTLTALATFFKVPISYFGEGEEAESVGDQVALLALLRESGVSRTALRSLVELSGESRQMITEMIESAARMERRRSQDGE